MTMAAGRDAAVLQQDRPSDTHLTPIRYQSDTHLTGGDAAVLQQDQPRLPAQCQRAGRYIESRLGGVSVVKRTKVRPHPHLKIHIKSLTSYVLIYMYIYVMLPQIGPVDALGRRTMRVTACRYAAISQ